MLDMQQNLTFSIIAVLSILLAEPVEMVINQRMKYYDVPSVRDITWKNASDRCIASGMQLCLKKDVCIFANRLSLEIPRKFVEKVWNDKYVAVADSYNEWLYLGSIRSRQCQLVTETEGPPVWKGQDCTEATKTSRKLSKFCRAKSGFYCCKRATYFENITPRPITVHIRINKRRGIGYHSFSMTQQGSIDSLVLVKWTGKELLSLEVARFTLMSTKVDGRFQDPIFFCQNRNPLIIRHRSIERYFVSDSWCPIGWNLEFYLYGSLKEVPESQQYNVVTLGLKSDLRTFISVNRSGDMNPQDFTFYGPKFEDRSHIAFFSNPTKNAECNGDTNVIVARDQGVISSVDIATPGNVVCRWKIRGSPSSVLRIQFSKMDLEPPLQNPDDFAISHATLSNFCIVERLAIRNHGQFCGRYLPASFYSVDNEIDVVFASNRSRARGAFSLSYKVIRPANGLVRRLVSSEQLTWTSANQTCADSGRSLCKASDVCGHTGRLPIYGAYEGDQWAPIFDDFNDWIQIGRGNIDTCKRHNDYFGPPLWGLSDDECNPTSRHIPLPCPQRGLIYCCHPTNSSPPKGKLLDVLIYSIVKNGIVFSK